MTLFELAAVLTLNKSSFDKGISEAEGQAQGFGGKLKSGLVGGVTAVAGALTAATGTVAAFAKESVAAGMTFDTSMSQVAATMGTTVDQIQDLRDFAQEMGAKTAFSASQAADALNYMALAGYDANTSMAMLPNVLNLAAAGGIELAYASDMITDSQSALGLSLEETSELVDKMAKASSKSNTSVAQLGEAILTVGGTAKTLAGGTTELSTALGILADNGVKGAEGGTALRNIILSLSAPTDTAAAAMENLGLEVFDVNGNMRPLNETFHDLDEALSTMTQGEQTQVLNKIFNKVDLKSVNALLANTNERFDELSGYIDDAASAAQAMADTQLDNLAGDITLFQSALEGAQIKISDGLTPSIREFVQFATSGIDRITQGFEVGGISGAFRQIGNVLSEGIGIIVEQLPQFFEAGQMLLEQLVFGVVENAPNFAKALNDITINFLSSLPVALGELSGEIGASIKKIAPIFKSSIKTIIGDTLPEVILGAVDIVTTLADSISEQLPTLIPVAVKAVVQFAQTLTDPETLTGILQSGLTIVTSLVQGILDAIPTLVQSLPLIIDNIVTFILDSIPLIINTGVQLLTSLVSNMDTIVHSIIAVIPTIISNLVNSLIGSIPQIVEAGVNLLVSLVQNLPTIITDIVTVLPTLVTGIVQGLLGDGNVEKIIMAGVQLFVSLVENLPTIILEICKAVPQIVTGIVGAFGELIYEFVNIGENLISGIWEGIQGAGDWLGEKVGGFFGGLVDDVKDFLGIHSPSKVFAEMGENMALGVGVGFDDEFKGIRDDINSQMDFSASSNINVNRNVRDSFSGDYEGYGRGAATTEARQPLIVVVQLESGLELARALIEDINNAKRIDGLAY